MIERKSSKYWNLKLLSAFVIVGNTALVEHSAYAQVAPDNTLGGEQSIVTSSTSNGTLSQQVEGGAVRGINLFHSFRDLNVAEGQSLYFQNSVGIRNIISRVTGNSPSRIEGTLGVLGGTANLFLLNPNGIIFGVNARLDVRGSFVATTATAIQFGTQGIFSSAASESPPLLTVNPSAFLFNQVAPAAIVNRSTALLASNGQGLQVPDGRSLLLLGGQVNLDGGGVNASGGRVELGAVAGLGTVGLSLSDNDLHLSFPATLDRADISLSNGATVNTSGEEGGPIQILGKRVFINSGSQVTAFTEGAKPGDNLTINASESLELTGFSVDGNVSTLSFGDGKAGDLTIETRRLSIRDGAQIVSGTLGNGAAGELSVTASELVEVVGQATNGSSSFLASFTGSGGQAGNLIINTRRLIIRDQGALSVESLIVSEDGQVLPVSGEGGNLTINSSDSVELIRQGFIFTDSASPGNAGTLTINTGRLLLQGRSVIGANSTGVGNAGSIAVHARSIELKNQSKIFATTTVSQGGNIMLQVLNLLLLRQNSSISTSAGTAQGGGDGGNITINMPNGFIVGLMKENSDITANAFTGRGGQVNISAQGIYGLEFRPTTTSFSDITASSTFGVNGVVTLNTPDSDPNRGLVQLPADLSDASRLIAQTCPTGDSIAKQPNEFIVTGRGGLPPTPSEAVNQDAIQVGLVAIDSEDGPSVSQVESVPNSGDVPFAIDPPPVPIVEAQTWQRTADGTIRLIAAVPKNLTVHLHDHPGNCHKFPNPLPIRKKM